MDKRIREKREENRREGPMRPGKKEDRRESQKR